MGGGGAKMMFPMTAGVEQTHAVTLGSNWTFDLSEPPATATAIYVDVVACLTGNPGAMARFKTPSSPFKVAVEPQRDCASVAHLPADARQAWFPSSAPHQIVVDVPPEFGSVGNLSAKVRVLGWSEP